VVEEEKKHEKSQVKEIEKMPQQEELNIEESDS
jgi:hypothetical protein